MNENNNPSSIRRFSSRRQRLDRSFLSKRLKAAKSYDRIAGYFNSSLIEVAGEELESVQGTIRMVCNSDVNLADVQTAKAAQMAMRRSWCASHPEGLFEDTDEQKIRGRFRRLHDFLKTGRLQVRVLPDRAFGLIHGKAGVITLVDGSRTCFMGSANESKSAWQINYELIWEDTSPEAVLWVQEEFDALWNSSHVIPLSEFIIQDLDRLSERKVVRSVYDWVKDRGEKDIPEIASVLVEAPVYRNEFGLWEHQKYFVKLVFDAHHRQIGKARFVLADQVGLGKTLQLAISALLIGLDGDRPILVICPKTLMWQWQGEMRELLDMPSAVWSGRHWIDENGVEYPAVGPEGIKKCPRKVGIVSSGLITHGSESALNLLSLQYDCVILDEAHRARRRNLGDNRNGESPDPNNLLRFMYQISERTQNLLLATATPVQLRPIEAWDLLDILSRGDESVLGNPHSKWRSAFEGLDLVMGRAELPKEESEKWEWVRNPLPPRWEHKDFEILRGRLEVPDNQPVVPGDRLTDLRPPDRNRLEKLFYRLIQEHNPFIRRIVRRTRQQLETQIDPETNEPMLQRIGVKLLGESDREAILLPPYLREAYEIAEEFCLKLGQRMKASGFLKTLLLRRMGSSIYAGLCTAQRMIESWTSIEEDDEDEVTSEDYSAADDSKTLTVPEQQLLERFVAALEANMERDPKYEVVRQCLFERGWLNIGCIVFSQYRDSIQWLAEQLTEELPDEPIALYSGPSTSGIMQKGRFSFRSREDLKQMSTLR